MSTKKKEEGPRSFVHLLSALADGRANAQLSKELHELTTRLRDESLDREAVVKWKLTVELSFTAAPNGVVGVAFDVKTKFPPKKRASGHFFMTEGGNLSATDERQPDLPGLREVKRENDELRDVHGVAEEG